ncbi:MAG: peptidase [Lachnospiraceae bacterium]|nr:peptidase [Lachnospiraceae bacterium]
MKMNIRKLYQRIVTAALAGVMILTPAATLTARANVIVSPKIQIGVGPGGSMQGVDTSSPDWADYKETGGSAQGAMHISTFIPANCINSCALDTPNPIVQNVEKYSYDYMVNDLNRLQQRYGRNMTYRSLATTVDGRNIYEVVIGNQSADTHILITASIHAREYITSNLCMKQIEYILAYADNGSFDGRPMYAWLNEVCLHFVPMINPDGVSISQFGAAGLRNQSFVSVLEQAYANDLAMQRTTLDYDTYLTKWKGNARGVNLNDNFNALTGHISYRTDQPSMDIYYGTPGSEIETQAMQQLIDGQHFKAILNYHATGSVLYWDFTENKLREHCRDLANNIKAVSGYPLLINGQEGGSMKAYAGTRRNPSTSITVEVGVSQCPVDPAEMDVIWAQNKFVPFYTMKWAKEKGT